MTQAEIHAKVRSLIGNPSVNEVSEKEIASHIDDALEHLAALLRYKVVTNDFLIGFEASVSEYPLPSDFARVLWVEHNTKRLTYSSTFRWDRDGVDWRNATAGTPTEYAIQGRSIIFSPPPDSTAITNDPSPTIRYIASHGEMGPTGPEGLSDLDQQVVRYLAAIFWLDSHPSDENQARIANYEKRVEGLVTLAKQRWQNASEVDQPFFRPGPHKDFPAR